MNVLPVFQLRLLAVAIAAAFAPELMAASTDTSAPSKQVTHVENEMVVYGGTYRNTATKTALEAEETPQGYSVVDQATLEMRNDDSVASALRYVSGVNTELRGGSVTRLDLFNIRGFINYQNFYDGLQLPYNDWNLQPQIDAKAVEQVEVFKGPTSTLYGAMPPGGMVNMISKKPQQDAQHTLELAIGSHDKREASFDSTGQIGDSDFSYRVVGLARVKDGQAVTSGEERTLLAPSLDWQVSDKTLVNFNLYYQKDPEMGVYNSLPATGLFLKNPNGKLSPDSYMGDANWNTYDREVTLLGYKVNHQFNDQWTFLHNARFMDASAYQENTYGGGLSEDMRTMARRAYLTDETSDGVTVDNQLSGFITLGGVEHNILVGLDYYKLDSHIKYEDSATEAQDLFAPNHYLIDRNTLNMTNTAYSSDFDIHLEQTGVYLQDQMRMDNLVVIAGLRYDDYKSSEKGRKYGAQSSTSLKQDNVSSRVGVLYELENGLAPFASYAESYEPVSGTDRHGNAYEPSTADQWETGVKFSSEDKQTSAALIAYQINKTNVLTRDPTGSAYDKIQAGKVRSQGLELEVTSQLSHNLLISANYTYQDVEVTKDNNGLEGKTPIWVPEQMLSVWANYDVYTGTLAGTTLGYGLRYIGESEIDSLNSDKVPSATLMDLSVAYDLAGLNASMMGASVRLTVNNLLDEEYYSCYDSSRCWFGSERNVEASLKYEF